MALRNGADNAFSTIDVQLRQRCDVVPNVVAAVKGYLEHERSTLERLTELRKQAVAEVSSVKRVALDGELGRLLRRLMVQVEDYPELKASSNVEQLQRTLNELEAQLAAARRTYNSAATDLNTALESFPVNLVGPLLGFTIRPLFESSDAEAAVPDARVLSDIR